MFRLKRNYFFEFSGMPKAGKTTTIECVRHLYRRLGFNVQVFSGHKRDIGIDKSNSIDYNIVLASRTIQFLLTKNEITCTPTIFLLDRGIFDRSVFLRLAHKRNEIPDYDFDVVTKFLMLPSARKLIDGLFVFTVEPELSLKREYSKTLFELPGRVMNSETLCDFNLALSEQYAELCSSFEHKFWIDTTNQTYRESSLYVSKQIWQLIGGDIDEFPLL